MNLIPTGVDTTKFFPGIYVHERQRLGWNEDAPVVLFNAGHDPKGKRLDLACEVIALARKSLPFLKFIVLRGEVAPDDVPRLMRAADCLLFTSDYEGSPTVIQEAMACNLPIVSVPAGDVPERLANISYCSLVPRDKVQLARAVVRILHDRPRTNGYEIAIAEVGNDSITRMVEKVYEDATKNRRRDRLAQTK